jgi:hypothetical protein
MAQIEKAQNSNENTSYRSKRSKHQSHESEIETSKAKVGCRTKKITQELEIGNKIIGKLKTSPSSSTPK